MTGWSSVISLAIGLTLYRTFYGDPGIIDSAIVGGLSGGIGGVIAALYQHYFGKHNVSVVYWIDNLLWFVLFCIPGAILGYIISSMLLNDSSIVTILVMVMVSALLTIRKIKKKEKLLQRDFFEDLH